MDLSATGHKDPNAVTIAFFLSNETDPHAELAALRFIALYRDGLAIELREREPREGFVIGVFLISQNADGHGLTQQYRLCGIGAPVQTRDVTCLGNIVGEFVQLTSERDLAGIRSRAGREGQTVRSGDHRIGKGDIVRIKECLQHGYAGAGHRGMTRPIAGMRRRTFRKGDG